ncbi:MAG: LamG-like jellyroll fold domain-containing protein [Phycisphaerae bacterium]|nr:LamG-like jellyroll fold domain-containing protein [Phycisphaerae bacterium]
MICLSIGPGARSAFIAVAASVIVQSASASNPELLFPIDAGAPQGARAGVPSLTSDPGRIKRSTEAQGGIAEDCDGDTFSQNVDPMTITLLNTPHCLIENVATLANGYARSFVAPTSIQLRCVTFATEFNTGPAWPVEVHVYAGDVHGPFADLTLISEASIEIGADSGPTLHSVRMGGGAVIPAGTSFIIEVFSPTRDPRAGGDGGFLFFGSNGAGQSAPSYIRAVECAFPDFVDVATVGFPQTNILIGGVGIPVDPIPACGSPAAGSCFVPHSTPNCNNALCCEILCQIVDPFCCQVAWDVICVQEAMLFGECTLQQPPCQDLRAYECAAGCVDNFVLPGDPTSPSAALMAGLNCGGGFGTFDNTTNDICIAHTFTGCWPSCGEDCPQPGCGTIIGATLEVRMKSFGGLASNDSLGLYDGGIHLWSSNIGTLTGNPGWPLNTVSTVVLNLGPNPIPGTIQVPASSGALASLCDGELGMLVQDDTSVDYAKLTVFVCPCDAPIRIPFFVESADGFVGPTPTTPSAELLATVTCGSGALQQYDVQALDQCFVETISGLPSCIIGATITIGVQPTSLWTTDGLAFEVINECGKTFKWSRSLTSLDGLGLFTPPLATGQPSTITLDLGDLPPSGDGTRSVLSTMLDGSLDIYLQDDTGVDFIALDVFSCDCAVISGPTGACCLPPGLPGGDYHCVDDLTQIQCEFNGGVWYGPNVACEEIICGGPCATPPWGMVAWFPLEPTTGQISDDLTIFQNDGIYGPLSTGGPLSGPAVVGGGYFFDGVDDNITVPADLSLDFSCTAFSIDMWVKRDDPGANAAFVNLVGTYGITTGGWVFGIDESTGQLEVLSESGCLRCIAFSTGTVPVDVWTHVAITVSACDCSIDCIDAPNRTVTFYIDGAPAGTGGVCCDLSTQPGPAPIVIGGGVWVSNPFGGGMDEIELFSRELFPFEIFDIFAAGESGKCRSHCHASWDRQVCINFDVNGSADITICNDGASSRTYSWFITESNSCPVTGLVYTPSSGTTSVAPGGCVTIPINVNTSGATSLGSACFDVTFVNTVSSDVCTASGLMLLDICGIYADPTDPVVFVPDPNPTELAFDVGTFDGPATVPFQVIVMPSDMQSTNELVKLNGLPPGTRYIGNLEVQPGATTRLALTVEFEAPDSFRWYDVIFKVDVDGDGLYTALSSIGIKQTASTAAPPCVGDLNLDGKIDAADLAILLGAWGSAAGTTADLNGDGTVNAADLALLLGAWGPCP